MATTTTSTYKGLTAEQWRAKARASAQAKADSYERSDTDGFMSQWANDLMATEYELSAALAETDGLMETTALFDKDTGEVASTHLFDGQYGMAWVLNDEATAKNGGKRFLNESKAAAPEKRYAFMAKKGFTLGLVRVQGLVAMRGANVTSVRPYTLADVDALKAGRYEVVTTDVGPDDYRN